MPFKKPKKKYKLERRNNPELQKKVPRFYKNLEVQI